MQAGLASESETSGHLEDAGFALALAVAGLSGRTAANLDLAAALDAQAFALRLEASVSAEDEARFLLAEADALHRRASRVDGLSRATSYRYRIHSRGAERERAVVKKQYGNLTDLRQRVAESLHAAQSRSSDRTSRDEQSVLVAIQAETALLVRDLATASPEAVSHKGIEEAIDAVRESHHLAETLFLPLDWLWTRGDEQDLIELL